ncbi:MAG: DUF5706 domain-containing protein [Cyclobacteriaceae bacterium]|nr:DUF5706 domain-containing protein [Cyclobacteriaceae bacterium]
MPIHHSKTNEQRHMEDNPLNAPENQDQPLGEQQQMAKDLKAAGRGKDTLFRVTIRNQVNQIAIADNKANMIISINTIIISLIIAGLGSGMSFGELNILQFPQIIAPLTILMVSCTISAIFSILAAKPRLMTGKQVRDPKSTSMLFFGNFKDLPLSEYIDEMLGILKSNVDTYRSLIIDQYYYGQILTRKYRLLSFSYTAFLVGLVVCVLTYLVLAWTTE